jgi:activating signal cointegrator complex subunit 3
MQVRHNEDMLNIDLSKQVRWPVNPDMCDQPHTKANLLFQAHFSRTPLPISDYITDTKLTLDNAIRLLQAMIDTVASQGWLRVTFTCIHLVQVRFQIRQALVLATRLQNVLFT